ncbi:hypothetical protein HXX76_010235 [Chlamydomonas incerta]|uniref:Protein kinase domain-containing protein n=1 Tax=Chlamydomonas incerta TaxID=51695 RepID=A0A835VYY0_CHLIN|nr:hypothetical protein HXX76_010235 [Chlamydomonas incerta]|eukprot:KAG2430136.1 hypothetical protein HXX76_010235 [Chlamydomonas incerta]
MAARHLTTCNSLETLMEATVPGLQGGADAALLSKLSNCDGVAVPAAEPRLDRSSVAAGALQEGASAGSSLTQCAASQATAAVPSATEPTPQSAASAALPPAPLPLPLSPFNAMSAPFLDARTADERRGDLPLCYARLGGSHSCTFASSNHDADAVPVVCIAALSGEEPLRRPLLSRPASSSNGTAPQLAAAGGGGGAAGFTAPATGDAAPAAAAKLAAASTAGALLAAGRSALEAQQQQAAVAADDELQQSRPQEVASLRELLADVDNLIPMATTAPAFAPAGAVALRGAGTWQAKQAVVVKLVAGGGGSGWCRPDAPMLLGAVRAARLTARHPNLAPVLGVRALVVDQAVLHELRQLQHPAPPPPPAAGAGLGVAAWLSPAVAAAAGQEAGLVVGAGAASGVLNLLSSGVGVEAPAPAEGAAAGAAAGALRPMGRLQRFLKYSPLGPPLPAATAAGVSASAATPLPASAASGAPLPHHTLQQQQQDQTPGLLQAQQQQQQPRTEPHLLPVLRALARLRVAPGGCVVAVITQMCDMGNLATLACAAESAFRPSRTWPLHVAHRALLRTAREVSAALSALHAAGVPHGCLTPSNVLIQSSDADRRGFIARVADAGSPALSDAATNPLASVTPRMLLLPPESLTTAGGASSSLGPGGASGSSTLDSAAVSSSCCAPAAAAASAAGAASSGATAQQTHTTVVAPAPPPPLAFAADVFSFGMLLYIMAAGQLPYADEHLVPALVGIAMDGRRPEWPTSACGQPLHPHLEPLYRACVAADPAQRPSAQQVYHRICHIEAQLKAAKAARSTTRAQQAA